MAYIPPTPPTTSSNPSVILPYTPVAFPGAEDQRKFTFKKDKHSTIFMARPVYQELYNRGCVDVNAIPAMDLQNGIHIIFRHQAFTGLTAEQYNFIRPALTLAFRFITEEAYMGFWAHLCTADYVEDTTRALGADEQTQGHVLRANPDISANEAVGSAQTAFREIAEHLSFFSFGEEYSKVLETDVAAAYAGDMHRICEHNRRVKRVVNNRLVDGTCECRWCVEWQNLRCTGCQGTMYVGETLEELQRVVGERGLKTKAQTVQRLIEALRRDDLERDQTESQETNGRVTNRNTLENMQIGLHEVVYKHIQEASSTPPQDTWSESEELRFQFSLAATLAHELAHVFWWWTQLRCFYCELHEPWWSEDEEKVLRQPELGNEWEWWAFGSRVPAAGRVEEDAQDSPPNLFSRSNWFQTHQTKTGGLSYFEGCVSHVYIFPVEWINSWFQEATWANIRNLGREAGRPTHDNLVIMSELGTRMTSDNHFSMYQWDIEEYSHPYLVAQGGFVEGSIKKGLYKKSEMRSEDWVLRYRNKVLRGRVEKRNRQVMRRSTRLDPRSTAYRSILSTYELNADRKIDTKIYEGPSEGPSQK